MRDMKERVCFVSADFRAEVARDVEVEAMYELPDGQVTLSPLSVSLSHSHTQSLDQFVWSYIRPCPSRPSR